MDNSVKILADFIVKDKKKVIRFLNERGYASLPMSATTNQLNYADAEHLYNQAFLVDLAELMFSDYRNQSGPPPPLPNAGGAAGAAAGAAEGANPLTYVIKLVEIGGTLFVQAKQAENQRAALTAQTELTARQIDYQAELAKEKAKQQFAFNLLQAQQQSSQKTNEKNLILLFGVLAFLGIAYYATRGNTAKKGR